MLEEIVSCRAQSGELYVMYDIACSLSKHLQVTVGSYNCCGYNIGNHELKSCRPMRDLTFYKLFLYVYPLSIRMDTKFRAR